MQKKTADIVKAIINSEYKPGDVRFIVRVKDVHNDFLNLVYTESVYDRRDKCLWDKKKIEQSEISDFYSIGNMRYKLNKKLCGRLYEECRFEYDDWKYSECFGIYCCYGTAYVTDGSENCDGQMDSYLRAFINSEYNPGDVRFVIRLKFANDEVYTESVYDRRDKCLWDKKRIEQSEISKFNNKTDMSYMLNEKLGGRLHEACMYEYDGNGDYEQDGVFRRYGTAYVTDGNCDHRSDDEEHCTLDSDRFTENCDGQMDSYLSAFINSEYKPGDVRFIIRVKYTYNRGVEWVNTESVYDCRDKCLWDKKKIEQSEISDFYNLDDMRYRLNENLCGRIEKYRFEHDDCGDDEHEDTYERYGTAYVTDGAKKIYYSDLHPRRSRTDGDYDYRSDCDYWSDEYEYCIMGSELFTEDDDPIYSYFKAYFGPYFDDPDDLESIHIDDGRDFRICCDHEMDEGTRRIEYFDNEPCRIYYIRSAYAD